MARRLLIVDDDSLRESLALVLGAEGYEVALLTRDHQLPFAGGPRQRRNVLECLATIEALPETSLPLLATEPGRDDLRLAMDRPSALRQVAS